MSQLFDFDKENKSSPCLIGTDEAGRGPLAGPVVSAAVCFPKITDELITELNLINDSKKLSHKQREYLYARMKKRSVTSSLSTLSVRDMTFST